MGQKISTQVVSYEEWIKELDKAFLIVFVNKLLHPERFKNLPNLK